jgi:hypothetical protein
VAGPPHKLPSSGEEFPLEVLEDDETVPPRPEEEIADLSRSTPDARRTPGRDR